MKCNETSLKHPEPFVSFALIGKKIINIALLINLLSHVLFPQYTLAANAESSALLFPYDKELKARYLEQKEKKEQVKTEMAKIQKLKVYAQERYHVITAYSSTPWETDDSPFVTAAGTHVRDGVVAANSLPFGTKILIPEIFGNKVFTVEDRMAPKNYHKIDIWFSSTKEAKQFGVKKTKILILPM